MTFHLGVEEVTHCLLIETADGLVLVDTGLGLGDYARPTPLVRAFTALNRVPCDPAETAIRQVVALGFAPEDVHHIALTHLHLDHAGGLPDFPWARVHVHRAEYDAAMSPRLLSVKESFYVAAHWAHGPEWVMHSCAGERWFGLDCMRVLDAGPVEVLLIPLPGHSRGHCGVAVGTQGGWLFHCGGAYLRDSQVNPETPHNPIPWWAQPIERWLHPPACHVHLQVLRKSHGDEVTLFCSHDRATFARLSARNSSRAT
jgi:glyoxylase-like metal-dependent hydrolase (beta-lactamase superfamily II)